MSAESIMLISLGILAITLLGRFVLSEVMYRRAIRAMDRQIEEGIER